MKAIQIRRFGGPEVLELTDLPIPEPGRGQVLIQVGACGVNFAETLMRADNYVAAYQLPATPGSEVAGTIVGLGPDVAGLQLGQRVGAVLAAARQLTGGYAEYAVAPAAVVVPLPDEVDFATATGLLVQGLTALFLTRAVPPAARHVMITAAGGGIGSLLVQLAKRGGASRVTAVASSAAKRDAAMRAGANAAIGYDAIADTSPDLIYESVGGDVLPACLAALAPHGIIAIYGALNLQSFALGVADLQRLVFGNQAVRGFAFGPLVDLAALPDDLGELFALHRSGKLAVPVERLPLDRAWRAHRMLADRASTGKIALVPHDA